MRKLILLIIFLPLPLLAQSPFLPLSHPAYDFLDRMETLGLLDHSLLGSKPITRARVAKLLEEVRERTAPQADFMRRGRPSLSQVDRDLLATLRWEFAHDAQRAGMDTPPADHPQGRSRWGKLNDDMTRKGWFTQSFYRNGLNFYSFESHDFDAYADPRGSARVIQPKGASQPFLITAVGVRLRGYISDKVGLYFDYADNTEQGRGPYDFRSQLYDDQRVGYVGELGEGRSSASYDVTEFDLAVGGKWWELHAAKTPLRWGWGKSGQLLLSDWGTSFHQVQFNLNLGATLRLVYVFGSLKSYPELNDTLYSNSGSYRTLEWSKYIAAHRLEWDPHPRLRLAFAEAVVFGQRHPELAYLIPINLFQSAQHDLGDEDNTLMSFDAAWIFTPRWKAYGELLIDDVTFGKLGSDFYGNKIGWLAGLTGVQPFGLKNFDATVEMAQLRPFVYTQDDPINVYQHWNAPLGYRYPPNSRTLFTQWRFRPHRRVQLEADYTYLLHGANTATLNAGGDLTQSWLAGASEDAPFLGGDLQESHRAELGGTYEVLENLYLWSKGSWIRFDGEDSWELEVGFRLN